MQPTPKEIAAIFLRDYLDAMEISEADVRQFLMDYEFKDLREDQEDDCIRHFGEMIDRCRRPVDKYLSTRRISAYIAETHHSITVTVEDVEELEEHGTKSGRLRADRPNLSNQPINPLDGLDFSMLE